MSDLKEHIMRVKYNRISSISQTGNRFEADTDNYDLVLLDRISGSVKFKDRPKSMELIKLINENLVKELVVEELSRVGRNTGDVILTLEWLEEKKINVVVKNIGLQSRPLGKKNPIWKLITSVMSSLYELELSSIKERTMTGRMVYVQKGGVLGRPKGTQVSISNFIKKPKSQKILDYINKGWTVREISKQCDTSTKTVMKVKSIGAEMNLIGSCNT